MIVTASSRAYDDAKLKRLIYSRRWTALAVSLAGLAAAALCAVSPWFGYAMMLTLPVSLFRSQPLSPTTEAFDYSPIA